MTKTLLIIGAGREQSVAYQKARKRGLYVVGTDQDPKAPAFEFADEKLLASTRDVQETLSVVTAYARRHPIHGVMTIANDVPLTVASVAQALGLPGISPVSARFACDKMLMHQRFAQYEVPCPRYLTVCNAEELKAGVAQIGYPAVLKPVDGRGSRGVLVLDGGQDLHWAYQYSLAESASRVLILETFLPGPQLSVEGLFVDGSLHMIAFADRNYSNLAQTRPYVIEDGGEIPSRYGKDVQDRIAAVMARAAQALGIGWGSLKGDIVLVDDQPHVLEVAARLSGNYLASHHIPWVYGVDLVDLVIRLCLAEPIAAEDYQPAIKGYLGVRYFFPPEGVITAIEGVEAARAREGVRMLDVFVKPGDVQGTIMNHVTRAGTIACFAPTHAEAIRQVEASRDAVRFSVMSAGNGK